MPFLRSTRHMQRYSSSYEKIEHIGSIETRNSEKLKGSRAQDFSAFGEVTDEGNLMGIQTIGLASALKSYKPKLQKYVAVKPRGLKALLQVEERTPSDRTSSDSLDFQHVAYHDYSQRNASTSVDACILGDLGGHQPGCYYHTHSGVDQTERATCGDERRHYNSRESEYGGTCLQELEPQLDPVNNEHPSNKFHRRSIDHFIQQPSSYNLDNQGVEGVNHTSTVKAYSNADYDEETRSQQNIENRAFSKKYKSREFRSKVLLLSELLENMSNITKLLKDNPPY